MTEAVVLRADRDAIATLTLNRPAALNALNGEVFSQLRDHLTALAEDGGVRVVVLRGAGEKAFAAGADVKRVLELSAIEGSEFARFGQRVMRMLSDLPKPTIAAVQGFCLGGGFEMALSCDMIWAAEGSTFAFPEVTIGLLPGWAGTQRLARNVGQNRAQDLILSGRKIKAAEAAAMGAIARVLPGENFFDTVHTEALKIAAQAPTAQAMAKLLVLAAADTDLESGSRAEATAFGLAVGSQDAKEGIQALLEKRSPRFSGR